MTEYQKTKVNSALGTGVNAKQFLSPRQLYVLNADISKVNLIDKKFSEAWYKMLVLWE